MALDLPTLSVNISPEVERYLGPVLVVLGLALALAGKALVKDLTFIVGAAVGGVLGFILGTIFGDLAVGLAAGAVGAVAGALILRFVLRVGVALLMGILAFAVVFLATRSLLYGLGGFVVVSFLTWWRFEEIIVLITAGGGALAAGYGAWVIARSLPLALVVGGLLLPLGIVVQILHHRRRKHRAKATNPTTSPPS